MKTYRITNRETRQTQDIEAESAAQACRACGWLIGSCYVQELGSKRAQALKAVREASAGFALASVLGTASVVEMEDLERAVYRAVHRAFRAGCSFDEVTEAQLSVVTVAA